MSNFKNWKDVKKEIEADFTEDDFEEMELEKQVIKATIEARKNANLTQQELSELSGIIQPSIAKIENFVRTPQYTTLMKLLRPMGYTLKVVPLNEKAKK
ncbi:MAG: helix-turn-helix transcriptional regulator [Clostridia bacterium]|nr:helix-turn-helix transcriptional regulator [Clostridia bacterium]